MYSYKAEKRSFQADPSTDSDSDQDSEPLDITASPIHSPATTRSVKVKHKALRVERTKTPGKRAAKSPLSQDQSNPPQPNLKPPPTPGQDQPLPSTPPISPSIIGSPNLLFDPTPPRPNELSPTRFVDRSTLWYTITQTTLNYCLNPLGPPPLDWEITKARWLADTWNHLVDPDPQLTIKHFLLVIPENMAHDEAWAKLRRAHQNLELAKWRPSSWTQQSWRAAMDEPFQLPPAADPSLSRVPEASSELTDLIKSVYTLTQHVEEGQRLMVSAINKFASIAEGSIRDTSQSIKSIFDSSVDRLHTITGAATTMAIPLAYPNTPSGAGSSSTPPSQQASTSTQQLSAISAPKLKKKTGKSKVL